MIGALKVLEQESKFDDNIGIVEFCEHPALLNKKLIPNQRAILKILTREPLDNTKRDIVIKDKFNEKVLGTFTEREYFDYLYENHHINMSYDRIFNDPRPIVEAWLDLGRRATKTTMIGLYAARCLFNLLRLPNPQKYFGVLDSDKFMIPIMSSTESNIEEIIAKQISLFKESPFFSKYIHSTTQSLIRFHTQKDLDNIKNGIEVEPSIKIVATVSGGIRGNNSILAVWDEFAFFSNSDRPIVEGSAKRDDQKSYDAVMPSLSTLKKPDGSPYGLGFFISTPNGKYNMFYESITKGFETGDDSYNLCMKAPTNIINPNVESTFLKNIYIKSPSTFSQEYQAEFEFSGSQWLSDTVRLYSTFDKRLPLEPKFDRSKTYFMGIDLGGLHDWSCISVAHYEPSYPKYEDPSELIDDFKYIDYNMDQVNDTSYIDNITGSRGTFVIDHNWYRIPSKGSPIKLEEVVAHIKFLFESYPCIKLGCYDQFSGLAFASLLESNNLQYKTEQFSWNDIRNDYADRNFQSLIYQNRLRIPYDRMVFEQIRDLRVQRKASGLIRAHNDSGHDDQYAAMKLALVLCKAWVDKQSTIAGHQILGLSKLQTANNQVISYANESQRARVHERMRQREIGNTGFMSTFTNSPKMPKW